MNLRAIRADAAYMLRQWTRSRSSVVVSLAMPLILLLALGLIFGGSAPARPVLVVDDADESDGSAALIAAIEDMGVVELRRDTIPQNDAAGWMRAHGAHGALLIPQGYAAENATLQVQIGAPDDPTATTISSAIEAALSRAQRAPDAPPALAIHHGNSSPVSYREFLLPGVIGFTLLTVGLPMGFMSVAELRHAGLLQRLAVSPMTRREWLLGRMLGISLIGLLVTGVLILTARLAFGVPIHLSWWTLPLLLGGTLVFSGLGSLLGLAVERPETGGAVMNLVLLPIVMLSGSFFDAASLPAILRPFSYASPLYYINQGLRSDVLGLDPNAAMTHAGALMGFALALLLFGAHLIRWTHKD